MKRFIFFIFSLLIASLALGQEADSAADTLSPKKKVLSGFTILADAGKPGLAQLVDYENKLAFSAHLIFFDHFVLSGEYGTGEISPEQAFDNVNYTSDGNFFRYGIDYQVVIKTKNYLSIGFRRANADYSDQGSVFIQSASVLSDDYLRTFSRNSLSANWWEVVLGSETKLTPIKSKEEMNIIDKLLDNFYFGLTYRLRFNLNYQQQEGIDTYTIPGYGRTFDNSTPAVNLFLKYRIKF
ncbi:MAG: DUF6048 family protein [Bacteroidota bacterium]